MDNSRKPGYNEKRFDTNVRRLLYGRDFRWLDRFCYKHPRLGIPGLMKYIVIANVAVYLMDMFSNGYFSAMLRFYPALIMEGQVWRLLTFIFVPTSGGFILWFALTTLFYYYIGNALENQWGSTRFTVFYGVGVLLNIFTGMVTYWISGAFLETASMYYVNMSMFFAFATCTRICGCCSTGSCP